MAIESVCLTARMRDLESAKQLAAVLEQSSLGLPRVTLTGLRSVFLKATKTEELKEIVTDLELVNELERWSLGSPPAPGMVLRLAYP
jgi:hypothetical protein